MIKKTTNTKQPELLTLEEFCIIFKITRITAVRWINDGKVKKLKIGGSVYIEQSEVDRLVKEGREAGSG